MLMLQRRFSLAELGKKNDLEEDMERLRVKSNMRSAKKPASDYFHAGWMVMSIVCNVGILFTLGEDEGLQDDLKMLSNAMTCWCS